MNSDTGDRWGRLGAYLIQRRTQLSPRFHNRGAFCAATSLKYRLVYDIEEARRTNFGSSTLAAIEAAYRLMPGAIGRFLGGGELETQPVTADAAAAADEIGVVRRAAAARAPLAAVTAGRLERGPDDIFPDMSPEMRAKVDRHFPAIEELVLLAIADGADAVPAGSQVFPDSPHEARKWDILVAVGQDMRPGRGYSPWEMAMLASVGRVRDDERQAGNPPARAREVLTFPPNDYASAGLTGAPAAR